MKKRKDSIKEQVERITTPIFNKVLKETKNNHTMVEKESFKDKKSVTYAIYNPHNYRLYFNFTKKSYNPKKGMVGVWFGKFKNYGKEFTVLGEGVRVTIKKTQAEIINKLTEEEWFLVNKAKAKEEIYAIINKIDEKCIRSFKKFIEIFGGESDFIILNKESKSNLILNTKSDNKIMKEKFIDSIPLKETFETPIVKKVYKKPNVEFKQPLYAAQHLENSALHDFSPEIAKELFSINQGINKLNPTLDKLNNSIQMEIKNKKLHLGVLKDMKKALRKIGDRFSQKTLKETRIIKEKFKGTFQTRLRW